jgi:ribosomal protein S18 acetylase RimI-like enzyme
VVILSESSISFKKKIIRNHFLNYEKQSDLQRKERKKEKEHINMTYIQMRLPIKKITPEFEGKLKKEIEQNILRAKIREATEQDLDIIMKIYNRAWMTSNEPFSPLSVDSLRKLYNDPLITIFIAKVYGMDAGFVILDFEGSKKEYGIIAALAVLPRFQRKGLGKILGMASWDYFKQRGVKELRCEVHINNNVSYNFIKSLGFEEFDRREYKKEDFMLPGEIS